MTARSTLLPLLGIIAASVLLSAPLLAADGDNAARPNFVIVLADDLGYGDLVCYGHPRIQTPHLDRFAAEGLRLTSCYAAAPNCSPSRTGLMTGRTPSRVGVYNWIPMQSPMHVRRSEITIATLLRNAGYDTCHTGKWHLNGHFNQPTQPQPWDHGFSHWFSTQNNALPNHHNPFNFVRNGRPVGKLEGYASELVANEAIDWLEHLRDPTKPFFLYVCFHEPHEPIASAQRFTDLYDSDDPSLRAHHGNISQMDAAFGRIVEELDRLDLRDDTFTFFTSDNGPAITRIHPHGSAGPLRDKKGSVYEGGIRVPGMIQWPGHVTPASTSDEPVCGVDLLPTLCEIAGIEPPQDRELDGSSITAVLRGEKVDRHRPLYWQFHRASGDKKVAMRDGDWKLLAGLSEAPEKPGGGIEPGEMEQMKNAELTGFVLYNLTTDIGEEHDVYDTHPQIAARLREKMTAIHRAVRDEGPVWPAWEFARYEQKLIEWPEYRTRADSSQK